MANGRSAKVLRQSSELEKITFPTDDAGIPRIHTQKDDVGPLPHTIYKTNSKQN